MPKVANFDNFFDPLLIELETWIFFSSIDLFARNILKKKLDLQAQPFGRDRLSKTAKIEMWEKSNFLKFLKFYISFIIDRGGLKFYMGP